MTEQDITPYIQNFKTKEPTLVMIDESTCIGCTKCIDACPTDAILVAGKKFYTVITDACTGCELCIPPCPVNCIEILPATQITPEKSAQWRVRYERKKERLMHLKNENEDKHRTKLKPDTADRKKAIMEALVRVQKKKN